VNSVPSSHLSPCDLELISPVLAPQDARQLLLQEHHLDGSALLVLHLQRVGGDLPLRVSVTSSSCPARPSLSLTPGLPLTDTFILLYNLIFTFVAEIMTFYLSCPELTTLSSSSLPVIVLGAFDQDVNAMALLAFPQLYERGIKGLEYTRSKFWLYMLDGPFRSPFFSISSSRRRLTSQLRSQVSTNLSSASSSPTSSTMRVRPGRTRVETPIVSTSCEFSRSSSPRDAS
jgi:hypothetical protein